MAYYNFVTVWKFGAPLAPVWDLIHGSERWPEWWRGVERVGLVRDGALTSSASSPRAT